MDTSSDASFDCISVIGVCGLLGYEHEINQCIGLSKDARTEYNLLLTIASINSYRYRKRYRHRIQYACLTGNYTWFKTLFDIGNRDRIRNISTYGYAEETLLHLLDSECYRNFPLYVCGERFRISPTCSTFLKNNRYYGILMKKGIRLKTIENDRREGQRKIFNLLTAKSSFDSTDNRKSTKKKDDEEEDSIDVSIIVLFRSAASDGNYLLLQEILKYASRFTIQDFLALSNDIGYRIFVESWSEAGLSTALSVNRRGLTVKVKKMVPPDQPQISQTFIHNQIRCIKILCGIPSINLNETNKQGSTLLIWATNYGYLSLIDELLNYPKRVNVNYQEKRKSERKTSSSDGRPHSDDDHDDGLFIGTNPVFTLRNPMRQILPIAANIRTAVVAQPIPRRVGMVDRDTRISSRDTDDVFIVANPMAVGLGRNSNSMVSRLSIRNTAASDIANSARLESPSSSRSILPQTSYRVGGSNNSTSSTATRTTSINSPIVNPMIRRNPLAAGPSIGQVAYNENSDDDDYNSNSSDDASWSPREAINVTVSDSPPRTVSSRWNLTSRSFGNLSSSARPNSPVGYEDNINDKDSVSSSDESVYPATEIERRISTMYSQGNTALHIACYRNNLDAVKRLLRFPNIDLFLPNNSSKTPLQISAECNPRIFRTLLSHAKVIEQLTTVPFPLEEILGDIHSLLEMLCSGPKPDTYADLIRQVCRIPLVRTVLENHYSNLSSSHSFPGDMKYSTNPVLFLELFDPSKYINPANNQWDMSPTNRPKYYEWRQIFLLACATNSLDMVQRFIRTDSFNLNLTTYEGYTGLMHSAKNGHVDIVTELLKCSPLRLTNLNQGDRIWDRTALLLAIDNGHISVVQRLCEHSAVDLNRTDKQKYCPLGLALRRNFCSIADELLRYYPGRLQAPYVSLHEKLNGIFKHALVKGKTDLVAYILGLPDTLSHCHTFLKTNLNVFFHCILRKPDLINLLYKYIPNSDIWNYPNKKKKTLLYVASESNNLPVVQRLCTVVNHLDMMFTDHNYTKIVFVKGKTRTPANRESKRYNGYGHNPLTIAVLKGHTAIVQELIKYTNNRYSINTPVVKTKQTCLHLACFHNRHDIVQLLCAIPSIGLSALDCKGNIPLILAASRGFTAIVDTLLQYKDRFDVNHRSETDGRSALWWACSNNHYDTVSRLLEESTVDLNITDHQRGCTPLMVAGAKGYHLIAREILSKYANRCAIEYTDVNNRTALHLALENNHLDVVREWIKIPNLSLGGVAGTDEWTPLIKAITMYKKFVPELLNCPGNPGERLNLNHFRYKKGYAAIHLVGGLTNEGPYDDQLFRQLCDIPSVDLNLVTPNGQNLLMFYIASNRQDLCQKLLVYYGHRLNINQQNPSNVDTVLHRLLNYRRNSIGRVDLGTLDPDPEWFTQTENVHRLFTIPSFDGNIENQKGLTPLALAVLNHDLYMVQILGSKYSDRININYQRKTDGWSILHFVCDQGNDVPMLRYLCGLPGIRKDLSANDGSTPFLLAVKKGFTTGVDELLTYPENEIGIHRPRMNQHREHEYPLHLAIMEQQYAIVQKLCAIPTVDLNVSSTVDGITPLILAASNGQKVIVEELLKYSGKRMDVNRRSKEGHTALFRAVSMNHFGIVQILCLCADVDKSIPDKIGQTALFVARRKKYPEIIEALENKVPSM